MHDLSTLLSTMDAAKLLKCHPTTVKRWRRDKTGPRYVRLGRLIRYRPEDIDTWIDDNQEVR